ncbi:restriction endonuclease [Ventosimonas gracilis]|uniref:Restriction endonuclease n=1 Tax=Ventosimonas gracilis TaxID=1680762 RepID=A0A139SV32_9GAMM|nr:type II restriction endonuclease [Ventosimonas gracilis]KXU38321.1 restriction endonuclease [Ventosimonas gracilis]
MKQGYLSQYFDGVAVKRLSAVEIDVGRSNQREFNGAKEMRRLFGEPTGKVQFPARFLYLCDDDDEPVAGQGILTWYDAREKARMERGVMRQEYRLYSPSIATVSQCAAEGDLLLVAKRTDGGALVVVAEKNTLIERQLLWLFDLSEKLTYPGFSVRAELETNQDKIGFAARVILEQIGVDAEEEALDYLEQMLAQFGKTYPKAELFSAFARNTLKDVSSLDSTDGALIAWMEHEEILYRTFENHLLCEQLQKIGQANTKDANPVIKIVQSTLQRRRSRAGLALENHMEHIFREHDITYTRGGITEGRLKPDFIFPGITHYHDMAFPENSLTMLAAKTTCKDRWRQIRNEAGRITVKHLLTLEPGISEHQTREMQTENVQLVLPRNLHEFFMPAQQAWLLDVSDFIHLVKKRQQYT